MAIDRTPVDQVHEDLSVFLSSLKSALKLLCRTIKTDSNIPKAYLEVNQEMCRCRNGICACLAVLLPAAGIKNPCCLPQPTRPSPPCKPPAKSP